MVRIAAVALAALATTSTIYAQTPPPTCSPSQKCPQSSPCCSQYGACGVGAYCLGGCDPRSSNTLDSCVPEPVCKSETYNFNSMNGITSNTAYLGDPSKTDWVMSGEAVTYQDTVLLTMAPNTPGTVLASSTYMWYGNVKATFKTSRGRGVVTAFILLSDVKDEIDYEFVGVDLGTAQTNYYFQGNPDYDNSFNISGISDTYENFHTYEIDWTPDQVTWLLDGQVGRTKKRTDTWNATSNQWDFPQTPARVQLSIWPGGLATNAPGTIAWAGGDIDWSKNDPDIAAQGYYYATFQSVTVSCFNATSPPGTNTGTSYTYNSYAGTNDTVVDGTKGTVLQSILGSGTDPGKEDPSTVAASSGAASSTAAAANEPATVPGLTNGGSGTDSHADSSSSASGSQSTGTSSSGSSGTISGTSSGGSSTCNGFCQDGSNSGSKSDGTSNRRQERALQGSFLAVFIAIGGVLVL